MLVQHMIDYHASSPIRETCQHPTRSQPDDNNAEHTQDLPEDECDYGEDEPETNKNLEKKRTGKVKLDPSVVDDREAIDTYYHLS